MIRYHQLWVIRPFKPNYSKTRKPEIQLTICIAAICDEGKSVVAASDRMITSEQIAIEFEHDTPKIYQVTKKCIVLSAGNALAHTKVVGRAKEKLTEISDPSIEVVASTLKDIYQEERRLRAESLHLKPRGMDLDSFYQGFIRTMPADMASFIDQNISTSNFGLELIVAGVDEMGAHIYGIYDPVISDSFDSLGFHAIGSGSIHAITMVAYKYESKMTKDKMKNFIFSVKKASEKAPGVGKMTDMRVISSNGIDEVDIKKLKINGDASFGK